MKKGKYAIDGRVFDIGTTVSSALFEGYGMKSERSNGNGSLMRIAPLALTSATDDEIRAVSAITHANPLSMDACVAFVHILRTAVYDKSIGAGIYGHRDELEALGIEKEIYELDESEILSGGYVLETLTAALWCGETTHGYRDCVLKAVNFGHDTDTIASVAGALAGAVYGFDSIPTEWIDELRGKEIIKACLF